MAVKVSRILSGQNRTRKDGGGGEDEKTSMPKTDENLCAPSIFFQVVTAPPASVRDGPDPLEGDPVEFFFG